MASFGEELKRERELRDISLKEISEATKISIRFLEALEQNNFDILPGGIFNRGFVRSYARFIGIDGEEMVNAYLHELSLREARRTQGAPAEQGPAPAGGGEIFRPEGRRPARAETRTESRVNIPPEVRSFSAGRHTSDPSGGRTAVTLWVLVVVVIVAALGFLTMSLRGDPAEGVAAGSHDQAVKARFARKSAAPPATASVSPQPEAPPPQEAADGGSGDGSGQSTEPGAAPAQDGSPASAETAAPPPPPIHRLQLRLGEFTRVTVECGGMVSLDQELWPGDSRTMDCAEPVVLSAANGGAVEYALDGGPTVMLGASGQQVEGLIVAPPPKLEQDAPPQRKDQDARP